MEATGLGITALAGMAITAIGALYLIRPRAIAATFGLPALPAEPATAWLRLKGVRDLVTGIVAGVLLLTATSTVIGWAVLAFALIPLGDAATVLADRGKPAAAWGIHGATCGVMLLGGVLLIAS